MKHKRVKYKINPICSYLVLSEGEYDMELEVLGYVWSDDFIPCTEADSELQTATQLLMNLQKQGEL